MLRDHDVRQALNDAIDRSALVNKCSAATARRLRDPLPPSVAGAQRQRSSTAATDQCSRLRHSKNLSNDGWVLGTTACCKNHRQGQECHDRDARSLRSRPTMCPSCAAAAQYLNEQWEQMGAQVNVQIYDQGDLSQNVIRPRKYDALLFGEVVGREPDLFAFWDSVQRNDPGLNIAQYANSTADTALEQLAHDHDRRHAANAAIRSLRRSSTATSRRYFSMRPISCILYLTIFKGSISGLSKRRATAFFSVTQWHTQTDYVWPLFVQRQIQYKIMYEKLISKKLLCQKNRTDRKCSQKSRAGASAPAAARRRGAQAVDRGRLRRRWPAPAPAAAAARDHDDTRAATADEKPIPPLEGRQHPHHPAGRRRRNRPQHDRGRVWRRHHRHRLRLPVQRGRHAGHRLHFAQHQISRGPPRKDPRRCSSRTATSTTSAASPTSSTASATRRFTRAGSPR